MKKLYILMGILFLVVAFAMFVHAEGNVTYCEDSPCTNCACKDGTREILPCPNLPNTGACPATCYKCVEAEDNETEVGHNNESNASERRGYENLPDDVRERRNEVVISKHITRNCSRENDTVTCERSKEMTIEKTRGNETIIKLKNMTITIVGEIETDSENRTFFKWNNVSREVKIMPDTASERAIEVLGLKVCNESNNCTIVLKEVGTGNQTKMAYQVKANEKRKFLWIFSKMREFKAEVDASTGVAEKK
jgi:hypothetical protein